MNDPRREQPSTRKTAGSSRNAEESGRVLFALIETARRIEERVETALAAAGLSPAKLGVLTFLARADGPLALSELAACHRCVRSNITQLVDRLEADGLVRRIDDPSDRRIVRAELTGFGRERQAAGASELKRVQAELASTLTPADREALQRALAALDGGQRDPEELLRKA